MATPVCLIDAFVTPEPFSGNPAGVCLLEEWMDEKWMQGLAMEMNQAETAFLVPQGARYGLRWFTPTVEVDLCGHATLASAHYLWESGEVPRDKTIEFETRSGILTATSSTGAGGPFQLTLDFPVDRPVATTASEVVAALGAQAVWQGAGQLDWFVEVPSQTDLVALQPDLAALAKTGLRGVVVTAKADDPAIDFVSRFFAPQSGIDEDPVTGSAHCALTPYWSQRLGRTELQAMQLSERKGLLACRLAGDRVTLTGQARTTLVGTLAGH
ncbi:MAG: PhzF family phenazine biosynthesis protein [Armatimonadetes bacterium]|nr:PhzF family phenazine biosynthesis protein [Armatimonadota bacterium]